MVRGCDKIREIKFKACNKKYKHWTYFSLDDAISVEGLFYSDYKNWCQYTGLKDKNGKEIYEGDILKSITLYGEVHYEPVVFKDGCFCKITKLPHNKKKIYSRLGVHKYKNKLIVYEVIGNIYENPELIRNDYCIKKI